MKLDAGEATDAERGESVFVLQAAELALHGDIAQIGRMGSGLGEPGLIVLVVPDAFTFGLARQGSSLAGPAISDTIQIFYSRDDADAWLSERARDS